MQWSKCLQDDAVSDVGRPSHEASGFGNGHDPAGLYPNSEWVVVFQCRNGLLKKAPWNSVKVVSSPLW